MRFDETLFKLVFSEVVYLDGKPVKTLLSKTPFKSNVQPLNGRELLLVPEHQRFIEQYWCFMPSPRTTYDGSEQDAPKDYAPKVGDVVHRNNVHYQVQDIENWGSYQKVRIMRVDVGDYQTP
jgi:hypothetical protein